MVSAAIHVKRQSHEFKSTEVRTQGALGAPGWAAMLFMGTLEHQPDSLTDFAGFAEFITTSRFLWSHLINSILGAAIGSIGVIGIMLYLQDSKAAGKAITAMVCMVMSNVLNSSIFGVAAFTQPAMGRLYLAGQPGRRQAGNECSDRARWIQSPLIDQDVIRIREDII